MIQKAAQKSIASVLAVFFLFGFVQCCPVFADPALQAGTLSGGCHLIHKTQQTNDCSCKGDHDCCEVSSPQPSPDSFLAEFFSWTPLALAAVTAAQIPLQEALSFQWTRFPDIFTHPDLRLPPSHAPPRFLA